MPQRARDSSICAGAVAPEQIQTLSAENSARRLGRAWRGRSRSTAWEEPYIGEESIMRPPAAKKARITLAQSPARDGVVADVEGDPAAQADDGKLLAGRRHLPGGGGVALGTRTRRGQDRQRAGGEQKSEELAAVDPWKLGHGSPPDTDTNERKLVSPRLKVNVLRNLSRGGPLAGPQR